MNPIFKQHFDPDELLFTEHHLDTDLTLNNKDDEDPSKMNIMDKSSVLAPFNSHGSSKSIN